MTGDSSESLFFGGAISADVKFLLPIARRWVAGIDLDDAIRRSEVSNSKGIGAIINNLGEHYRREAEVEATMREYGSILDRIGDDSLDACISIKPTQLGLTIDEGYCSRVLRELQERCQREDVFLWLDMEESEYTSATLRVYRECLENHPKSGLALQANLKRTEEDLRDLLPEGGIVRLVKGAYREDRSISFRRKRDVDESFRRLTRILFEEGGSFALGTHDELMIREGLALQKKHQRDMEFQMILGVRDDMKAELRSAGHRVLEYIPYGPRWLAYFSRRLRERPRNLVTMFRSLIDR